MEVNKVIHGDCFEILKTLPDNSVDAVITDPPYGIAFMNRKWDYQIPTVELWQEVLRILKHGGHALVACGTRTQHRMAVNLEDAGFEIRDIISWVYGCLSEDTEILTINGWERYHKDIAKNPVLCYDVSKESFSFQLPTQKFLYENQHSAYRIQSDFTDQIVSRNHRCIVKRKGKLVFEYAETLQQQETIPFLESLSDLPETIPNLYEGTSISKQILLQTVCRGSNSQKEKADRGTSNDKAKLPYLQQRILQADISPQEKQKSLLLNNVCGKTARLVKTIFGKRIGQKTDGTGVNQCRSQKIRTRTAYKTTLATVEPIEYKGFLWCVEVPTGAFVARRNGKIFITGNSGFPKSLNVGKAIDKLNGDDREVVGIGKGGQRRSRIVGNFNRDYNITKGNSEWEGWGSALKPAVEFFTLCRKPLSESTIAKNVLKWGTGAINIDDCRIGNEERMNKGVPSYQGATGTFSGQKKIPTRLDKITCGRFPANFIWSKMEDEYIMKDNLTKEVKDKLMEWLNENT